jgi:metal-sulfur cluster biosynthetic enzyme
MFDRDNEKVVLKGIIIPENGVVFIDGHQMNGSVVETRLGTVKNIRIEGSKLIGDIFLVNTEKGCEVKAILDDPNHHFPVSMGFGVIDYNIDMREITSWELFELSAVNVPANVGAKVVKSIGDIDKKLKHYEVMRPAYKEFLKSFLSDAFCNSIGYKKTGELIVDISNVYEIALDKLKTNKVETPQVKEIPKQPKQMTQEQAQKFADLIVSKILKF